MRIADRDASRNELRMRIRWPELLESGIPYRRMLTEHDVLTRHGTLIQLWRIEDQRAQALRSSTQHSRACWVARFRLTTRGQYAMWLHRIGVPAAVLGNSTYTVEAVTALTVCELDSKRLPALFEGHPELALSMLKARAVESERADRRLTFVGQMGAAERIAYLMLDLHHRLLQLGHPDGAPLPFPLQRAQIADAVGVSRVHVMRALRAAPAAFGLHRRMYAGHPSHRQAGAVLQLHAVERTEGFAGPALSHAVEVRGGTDERRGVSRSIGSIPIAGALLRSRIRRPIGIGGIRRSIQLCSALR